MKTIKIHSRFCDYSVIFSKDFIRDINKFDQNTTAYIIDKNVWSLYKDNFNSINKEFVFMVDAVESKKNMDTVLSIITFWKQIDVKKNWKVICFGGGITQDLATISCNLYLRNIEWYFFPTTLLAMCDSCIGGKCGINFGPYKNQIGVFYPPKQIIINVDFLKTLTNSDYLNGWGEILKFSLTNSPVFYDKLKKETSYIPCDSIEQYIFDSLEVKKKIIEEDEFESDLRRILNYGHSFGHALEGYTDNKIPHGKGVIWGIDVVNYIAAKEGLISDTLYFDIKSLIKHAFLPKEIVIDDIDKLFDFLRKDKKVINNNLNFAMLDSPSHLIIHSMKIDNELKKTIKDYLLQTHEYYSD